MLTTEEVRKIAWQAHSGQAYNVYNHMYHVERVVWNVIKWAPALFHLAPWLLEKLKQCAYLHDVVEDTSETIESLRAKGVDVVVLEIVDCVTDGTEGNRKERKERPYLLTKNSPQRWEATFVKLCDRIANVEFTLEDKSDLIGMYRKEHTRFKEALYNEEDGLEYMWDHLDFLLFGVT